MGLGLSKGLARRQLLVRSIAMHLRYHCVLCFALGVKSRFMCSRRRGAVAARGCQGLLGSSFSHNPEGGSESLPLMHVSSTSMALTFLGKADFASRFCVELPIDERSRGVGALVELSFVHDAGVMLRLGPSRWPGTEFLKYQLHIADVNRHGLHSD